MHVEIPSMRFGKGFLCLWSSSWTPSSPPPAIPLVEKIVVQLVVGTVEVKKVANAGQYTAQC